MKSGRLIGFYRQRIKPYGSILFATTVLLLGFVTIPLLMVSCGPGANPWDGQPGPPRVVVSFAPLECFVRNVGGDNVGVLSICSAGTSDLPVAEEAAVTAELMGNCVERLYDVGVAGLHRLLGERERLTSARAIVVVAGMEGALPSVVAGLVSAPVIAVPTSVGYGASFGGIAALLGMLNSCASGVSVVNIDNGFGAAYAASLINHT